MLANMNSDEPIFFTVAEAASHLRSGVSTVRSWIRENRVPTFRIGRRLFIKKSDLETLLVARPVAADGRTR